MLDLHSMENCTGQLVLNCDGAVLSSHGDLQNGEKAATTVYGLLSLVNTVDQTAFCNHGCQKFVICFDEFSYTVCQSNKKILILKRCNMDNSSGLIALEQ